MKRKTKKKINIKELEYIDPIEVFKRLQDYNDLIFFDSASKSEKNNRYSYIALDPVHSYKVFKQGRKSIFDKKTEIEIKKIYKKLSFKKKNGYPSFQCGFAGYITYDQCLSVENIKSISKSSNQETKLYLGLFDIVIAFDLKLKKAFIFSYDFDHYLKIKDKNTHQFRREKIINLYKISRISNNKKDQKEFNWVPEISKKQYIIKVKKLLNYIKSGDIFQANFTQRFKASIPKNFSSIEMYLNYRERTNTPFSAFIKHNSKHILSYSPERFLRVNETNVLTSPIKGTIKRGEDLDKDLLLKNKLLNSSKDLAENLMIVDVLRNDISRVCDYGSVKVSKLAKLESYQNVHHLVSSIEGKLSKYKDIFDLLNATLPGGSITGAPKVRAMEIISELEKSNRGVYCGTIGYMSFSGYSDFNIPIRTITIENDQAFLNSGGGIVADSLPLKEYSELMSKVSNLFPRKKKRKYIQSGQKLEI